MSGLNKNTIQKAFGPASACKSLLASLQMNSAQVVFPVAKKIARVIAKYLNKYPSIKKYPFIDKNKCVIYERLSATEVYFFTPLETEVPEFSELGDVDKMKAIEWSLQFIENHPEFTKTFEFVSDCGYLAADVKSDEDSENEEPEVEVNDALAATLEME